MKQKLFFLLMMVYPLLASAGDVVVDGIKYSLDEAALTAEATGLADSSLTSLVIPATVLSGGKEYQVLSVGDNSFSNNYFTSISLPEGLVSIGAGSFTYSWRIKCLMLPNSVQTIGSVAFSHCTSMKLAVLGKELKTIGEGAFHETGLKEMQVYASQIPATVFDTSPFPDGTSWRQMELYVPENLVEDYRASDMAYWSQIQDNNIKPLVANEVVEQDGLTYYLDKSQKTAKLAFSQKDSPEVVVPANVESDGEQYAVTSIAKWAFSLTDMSVLKTVTLPEGLLRIENRAFEECGITEITLPNSVEFVGELAFATCRNLNIVRFGENIRTVEEFAFTRCSSLGSFYLPGKEIPAGIATYGLSPNPYAMGDLDEVRLYVPEDLVETYRNSTVRPWADFKDKHINAIGSATSIQAVEHSGSTAVYRLNGSRLKSPAKGINIIRKSDGTVRKEIIR